MCTLLLRRHGGSPTNVLASRKPTELSRSIGHNRYRLAGAMRPTLETAARHPSVVPRSVDGQLVSTTLEAARGRYTWTTAWRELRQEVDKNYLCRPDWLLEKSADHLFHDVGNCRVQRRWQWPDHVPIRNEGERAREPSNGACSRRGAWSCDIGEARTTITGRMKPRSR